MEVCPLLALLGIQKNDGPKTNRSPKLLRPKFDSSLILKRGQETYP